jgi:hypothetical protein
MIKLFPFTLLGGHVHTTCFGFAEPSSGVSICETCHTALVVATFMVAHLKPIFIVVKILFVFYQWNFWVQQDAEI